LSRQVIITFYFDIFNADKFVVYYQSFTDLFGFEVSYSVGILIEIVCSLPGFIE